MDTSNELADITIPLIPYLSRTFAARELVRLKCVSKVWKHAVSENSMVTRSEDDIEDWYFPLRFELGFIPGFIEAAAEGRSWLSWNAWAWFGIHHTSGEIHRLPSLPSFHSNTSGLIEYRPQMMESSASFKVPCFDTILDCLVASAGGLLLFTEKVHACILSSSFTLHRSTTILVAAFCR